MSFELFNTRFPRPLQTLLCPRCINVRVLIDLLLVLRLNHILAGTISNATMHLLLVLRLNHILAGTISNATMPKLPRDITGHFLKEEAVVPQRPNGFQPIFNLPFELLCNIFLKTLDDGDHLGVRYRTPGLLVSEYCSVDPTVLTRVCSLWRHVALNYPGLWSRIHLLELKKTQIRPLRNWLERSKDCPLKISIDDNRDEIEIDMASARKILSLIFAHSSRWHKISFEVGLWSVAPMLKLIRSSDPCHWLTIAHYGIVWIITQPTPPQLVEPICDIAAFLHASPALERIGWYHGVSNILNSKSTFTNLNWVSLEFPIGGEGLLQIAAELPNIRYLRVRHWAIPCSRINFPVIVLEKLEELHINSYCPLDPFLKHVALPSLKILEFLYRGLDSPYDSSVFRDFLQRSDCRLEEFKFFGEGPEDRLEEFFTSPQFIQLTSLDLAWSKISDRLIRLLSFSDEKMIMPNLRSLRLNQCSTTEDGLLSCMLSSRWYMPLRGYSLRPAGRLGHATISCAECGPIDKAFFKQHNDKVRIICIQRKK